MSHVRNTVAMQASPRCGAKTRAGGTCHAPAMLGKMRCRMHGGALRSGAPKRNQNARTHGFFTKKAVAERAQIRDLLAEARNLLGKI